MQQYSLLVVTEVLDESLAERSGVEFGDIIVSVDGNLVTKNYALAGALSEGGNVVRVFGSQGVTDIVLDGQKLGVVTEERDAGAPAILKDSFNREQCERAIKGYVDNVILTTTPDLPGYTVVNVKGNVTAEAVVGMNALRDILVNMRDVFGGRSKTSENALKALKTHALEELKIEASKLDANAVVAIDLDYSELSGNQMLFLVASGTAVNVEKIN